MKTAAVFTEDLMTNGQEKWLLIIIADHHGVKLLNEYNVGAPNKHTWFKLQFQSTSLNYLKKKRVRLTFQRRKIWRVSHVNHT